MKILEKMEHFNYIFKHMLFLIRQKALLWSKVLSSVDWVNNISLIIVKKRQLEIPHITKEKNLQKEEPSYAHLNTYNMSIPIRAKSSKHSIQKIMESIPNFLT